MDRGCSRRVKRRLIFVKRPARFPRAHRIVGAHRSGLGVVSLLLSREKRPSPKLALFGPEFFHDISFARATASMMNG